MVGALPAKEASQAERAAAGVLKVTAEPVRIDTGLVRGLVVGPNDEVRLYRGIPYAAPPVGPLRWQPPQAAKAWEGIRECYEFGPAAPQRPSPMLATFPGMALGAATNEDCLYLNVWTPATRDSKPLPVMVWIHGGGYVMGSGSQRLYEATDLARRGVVVVSINYRLGALGFLAHPQLTAESPHAASGNYGLLDQIEALRWVRRNIAAFGGDPQCVTIFGESAGGGSVFSLLVSPPAKDLFHRAIAESGPALNYAHLTKPHYGFEPAERMGVDFANKCGAPEGPEQLSALRAMSAETLVKAVGGLEEPREFTLRNGLLRMAPIVDGWVIPDDPMTILAQGRQNAVPLIVGANQDEGTMFTLMTRLPKSIDGWHSALASNFEDQAATFRGLYPAASVGDIRGSMANLLGDLIFVAPARYVARQMKNVSAPAYLYHFAHRPPGPTGNMLGAHHGAEIAYVLDNLELSRDVSKVDEQIRDTMLAYWVQFATTGNPNRDGLPSWPAYDAADRCLLVTDTFAAAEGLRKERLDAIEAFIGRWRKASGISGP
jgi:para-nitrobenzyl esterase